jgi:hypothetical protein
VIVVALAVGVAAMFFVPQKQFDALFYWVNNFGRTPTVQVEGGNKEAVDAPANRGPSRPAGPGVRAPDARPAVAPVAAPALPSCDAVDDTKTACTATDPEAAARQLELAPKAYECWEGSFYTCEELAEMGTSGQ